MLSNLLCLLALTATALAQTSPLFLLKSTAELPIEPTDFLANPPVSHVQGVLWRSLARCPTKHYVVVVEPLLLSYTSSFVPEARNARSTYLAKEIDGKVNLVHVLNTILMDCLHHGVLKVEELDTKAELPALDKQTIRKSIMYANMPEAKTDMGRDDYTTMMYTRKQYVEQIIEEYFEGQDYTMIYIREQEVQVEDEIVAPKDGQEIPLVGGHKA